MLPFDPRQLAIITYCGLWFLFTWFPVCIFEIVKALANRVPKPHCDGRLGLSYQGFWGPVCSRNPDFELSRLSFVRRDKCCGNMYYANEHRSKYDPEFHLHPPTLPSSHLSFLSLLK